MKPRRIAPVLAVALALTSVIAPVVARLPTHWVERPGARAIRIEN